MRYFDSRVRAAIVGVVEYIRRRDKKLGVICLFKWASLERAVRIESVVVLLVLKCLVLYRPQTVDSKDEEKSEKTEKL